MEKVKQKIKEIFTDKKLYFYGMITLLFFGIYCLMQYAPDTYGVLSSSLRETVMHFLSCGRVVTGIFIYTLVRILKLGETGVYIVSYVLAILCTIISMYKLDKLFQKDIKNKTICVLASIFIIINVFSIELYVYIEKGILMLSVLLCIMAVEEIRKFWEGNKKRIIFSLILMIIANCCYQGTVGLFVAISLLYIIKYSKNIKKFIVNNIIVALTYGIPAIINFIMVRFIFTNSRVSGEIILSESIQKIYQGTKNMLLSTYGLLPKYLFFISIIIVSLWIIYKIIKKREKTKILEILGIGYIILGTIFSTVVPQIMQDTNSIWFVARSSYSAGALIGILLIYANMKFEIEKKSVNIILILSCIFLIIQFVYFINYTVDNYKVNYEDRQIVEQIERRISQYEKETGKTITKIAIYEDKAINYTYQNIKITGDMNLKALYPEWSTLGIIRYYTGRELEQTEKDENIEQNFKDNNWDYYNDNQIILEEETMHLCRF